MIVVPVGRIKVHWCVPCARGCSWYRSCASRRENREWEREYDGVGRRSGVVRPSPMYNEHVSRTNRQHLCLREKPKVRQSRF